MNSRKIQDELNAKRASMAQFFDSKRNDSGELDMSMADVEKARSLNDELTDLGKRYDAAVEMERIEAAIKAQENTPVNRLPYPNTNEASTQSFTVTGDGLQFSGKSLGERFIGSREYKSMLGQHGGNVNYGVEFGDVDVKTTMTTAAGFAPESLRTGVVVPYANRRLRIADLIPQSTTTQAAVKYMEETTFTNAAAERAEGNDLAESALAYTERTSSVRSIGHFIPVTEEQLEDAGAVAGLIDSRLIYMVGLREDYQLINGDGNAPNLRGFLNTSNVMSQARGSDTNADAIYKSVTKIGATGHADADAVIVHPTNWESIRLSKAATTGTYLFGEPADAAPERIWGLNVVVTTAIAAGTALVGSFRGFSHISRRQGIRVEVGMIGDDFKQLIKSIRAVERISLEVYRPTAFCQVTSLT